jgi:monoamine oxidase
LAAGHRLAANGTSCIILEAHDVIGGRVHTLREPGWEIPIEIGAEFIHGNPDETWSIVRSAQLATVEVPEDHETEDGGEPEPLDFDNVWDKITSRLAKLNHHDLSFAEFLRRDCTDLPEEARSQAIGYVEGFEAADPNIVSAIWLREAEQAAGAGGGAHRIRDGYSRIMDWLASGRDVRLGRVVRQVRWSAGNVEAEAERADGATEVYTARRAVITLPVGVLQAPAGSQGAVRFAPDTIEKRAIWQRLQVGPVVKLVLRFRTAFWRENGNPDLVFLHTPSSPILTWWTARPSPAPILTGWSGGPAAAKLSRHSTAQILDEALATLQRTFSSTKVPVKTLLEAWHVFNWQADPYARGAYCYVPAGGLDLPQRLAEPVAGTLFFAGEATHTQLMGTVAGAIASGYRAAEEVLASR